MLTTPTLYFLSFLLHVTFVARSSLQIAPPQQTTPPKAQELDWGLSPSNLLGMDVNLWQPSPALLVLVLF